MIRVAGKSAGKANTKCLRIQNFVFRILVAKFNVPRSGILAISSAGSKILFFEVCQFPESYFQNLEL